MSKLATVLIGMLLAFSLLASAAEPPQNFVVHEAPVPIPEISFEDGNGKPKTLADFHGKVVLLN
ncbi:MAG: TlpA family protein disulfide reductase, partial [Mesorhizobium sp.]